MNSGGTNVGSPVWWGGKIEARTGCQPDGTQCLTADCTTTSNSNCPTGVGGTNPSTLAEFTLQTTATDFYDVSVINGANLAVAMQPIPTATQTPGANPLNYWCATPGGSCAYNFGDYTKTVPLPSQMSPTDYTNLLLLSSDPCTVGSGSPPTGCPAFTDGQGKTYQCSGLLNAQNGTCYKTCTSNSDCPTNLKCLPAGDGTASYCQCSQQSDCPGQFCGSQFINGVSGGSGGQLFLQQCGSFQGWWTADDFCGNVNNIVQLNGTSVLNCAAAITDGDSSSTNIANLLGCGGFAGGNTNNAASCYNTTMSNTGCCGCATDSSNPLSTLWPTTTTTCDANNTTWAGDVQPWLANLKQACSTAYSYPYDDATSTFQCQAQGSTNLLGYVIQFGNLPAPASE